MTPRSFGLYFRFHSRVSFVFFVFTIPNHIRFAYKMLFVCVFCYDLWCAICKLFFWSSVFFTSQITYINISNVRLTHSMKAFVSVALKCCSHRAINQSYWILLTPWPKSNNFVYCDNRWYYITSHSQNDDDNNNDGQRVRVLESTIHFQHHAITQILSTSRMCAPYDFWSIHRKLAVQIK